MERKTFIQFVQRSPRCQLITGWANLGSWKDSAVKDMEEHCLPLESSLKRSLPSQKTLLYNCRHDKQLSNSPAFSSFIQGEAK